MTRETVLKAARKVFSRKGFSSTRLEDIASEAGVTRGAIYWHFEGKADLYNSLVDSYSALPVEIVQGAVGDGGSLVDILRRVFIRMLEAVESNAALREVMEIDLFKTERTTDLNEGQQQRLEGTGILLRQISEAMQQGVASGELRADIDPDEMARAFLAFQNGMIYLWLVNHSAFSLQESAPALADIFLQGVLPGRKEL
jgi:TetR/AcrR family acrAB operon transcriptional repressor